ncbi:MAG: HEAT repeat domain-containing protein [Myxococcaceae bacterium]
MRTALCCVVAVSLSACSGSRDKLIADLQSGRPEDRARAVRKLSDQGRADDLVLFTRAAKDPAPLVRGEAVAALAKSQDQRVVDLLGELLGYPDEGVQSKDAGALAELKGDKSKGYLTSQYARRSRSTRIAIVNALKAANVPGAMASVVAAEARSVWERNLAALTSGSMPEKVTAAEELGKSGRVEAVNRLLPLVKDSQVILASAAVRGLGFTGDKRMVAPISELLKENFPELRDAACESLLRLQDASALPKLQELATEKSSASPQATAAILALPHGPEQNAALCAIVLDGREEESRAAGSQMRQRGGCAVEPILDRLSKQPSLASGLQAVIALGPTAKGALPKVLTALSSTDVASRLAALEAVAELGDASALPAVLKVYEQELKTVEEDRADWITTELPQQFAPTFTSVAQGNPSRARRTDLLQKVRELNAAKADGSQRVFVTQRQPPELIDDASDDSLRMLAASITAMGALKAPGSSAALQRFADDPSPSLRQAAYVGLAKLGEVTSAAPGLLDENRQVQGEVARALAASDQGKTVIAELLPRLGGERIRLLDALKEKGAKASAVRHLIAVLQDGGADAAIASQLLGSLKATDAVPELIKALDDPNAAGRREVLTALGQLGDRRAAETVTRDLYHDNPDVRSAAAEALGRLGTPASAEPLDALKGDYFRRVRENAQAALTKLGAGGSERSK